MVNGRKKGAAAERELGHILADHGWRKTERLLDQTREGGCDINAISPSGAPHRIEVKRRKSLPKLLTNAMRQARAPGHRGYPVVIAREDGDTEWYVWQPLSDWMVGR